jgi:glycosyltransferase involved in cell wall biosynthesis
MVLFRSFVCRKRRIHLFFRRPLSGEHYSIERLFQEIARQLPDEFEIHLLTCPLESKGLLSRLLLIVWAAFKQGDVNHITGDINFLGLLMRPSRSVLTIHDCASMKRLRGVRRWVYQLLWLKLPVRCARFVTVISQSTYDEVKNWASPHGQKIHIIPNCVTLGPVESVEKAFPSRPRVLIVGTKPNKNVERIIQAVKDIPLTLVIVGSLSRAQHILLTEAGVDFELMSNISDEEMSLQYCSADLVAFVPTYEGFGLPILEAQIARKFLITSNRPPMKDVAGEGSCLVDPEDVSAIRGALLRATQDPVHRSRVISAGSANVERYSPKSIADQYALLYRSILKIR